MPTIRQPTHQETAAEMMARFLQEGRSEEAHDVTAGTRLTSTQHHTGVPQAPRPLIVHQRYPVPSQQSFPVTPFNVEQRHPAYANVQLRAVQGGVPSSVPAQPAFATGQQRAYPPIPFYPPGVAASSYTAPINAPRPAPPTFRGHEDYTRAGVESFIRAAQERDAARREAHQAVRARLHAMNQESEVLDAASRGQKMPETAQRGHGNQGMAELALEQRRAQRLRRERFEERERVLRGDPDPQDAAREANYQRLVEYLNYPNYSRRAPDPLFPRAHVVAENPENQRLVSMFETALNNLSLYIEGYTNFQGGPSSQTEQVSTGRASTGQQSSRPNTGRTTSEIPNWNDPSIRNNPHIRREFLNNATFVPYMGPSGQGHHPRVFRDDLGVPLIDTKTPPTSVPMSLRSSATPSQPGNTRLESIPEEQETQHQPAPGSTRSTVVTGVTFASVLAGTSRTTEPAPAPPSLSMALAQRPASEAMDPAQMNNPGQATLTEQLSRGSTSMMRTQTLNRPGSQNSNGTPTPRRRRYRSRR